MAVLWLLLSVNRVVCVDHPIKLCNELSKLCLFPNRKIDNCRRCTCTTYQRYSNKWISWMEIKFVYMVIWSFIELTAQSADIHCTIVECNLLYISCGVNFDWFSDLCTCKMRATNYQRPTCCPSKSINFDFSGAIKITEKRKSNCWRFSQVYAHGRCPHYSLSVWIADDKRSANCIELHWTLNMSSLHRSAPHTDISSQLN